MRLWSLHPKYLDRQGLLGLWREGLLAQKVLSGQTRGYRNHPQLARFRAVRNSVGAIGAYLRFLVIEANRRGYRFNNSKIKRTSRKCLRVTRGQIEYESKHLGLKLKRRDPELFKRLEREMRILPHPLFRIIPGDIASWERGTLKK